MRIPVAPGVLFDPAEIEEQFIAASGPGGQNVNKVATAVQVRLDLRRSGSLPAWLRSRAQHLAGARLSAEGVLVITAQRHRSQLRNREDALERVLELLRAAAVRPKHRVATKPSAGQRRQRMEAKAKRGATKQMRGRPDVD